MVVSDAAAFGAPDMVSVLKAHGIDKAIVSSSLAIVYDFREGNRILAEAIQPRPELFGYVTINLNYAEAGIEELDTYAANPKFVGCKILTRTIRGKRSIRPIGDACWGS